MCSAIVMKANVGKPEDVFGIRDRNFWKMTGGCLIFILLPHSFFIASLECSIRLFPTFRRSGTAASYLYWMWKDGSSLQLID
jgi:hypothetical protein